MAARFAIWKYKGGREPVLAVLQPRTCSEVAMTEKTGLRPESPWDLAHRFSSKTCGAPGLSLLGP